MQLAPVQAVRVKSYKNNKVEYIQWISYDDKLVLFGLEGLECVYLGLTC